MTLKRGPYKIEDHNRLAWLRFRVLHALGRRHLYLAGKCVLCAASQETETR